VRKDEMRQVAVVTGCNVWIAVVTVKLVNIFSARDELKLLKKFWRSGQCVFFVRCELRLKKQLRTALFCVTVQNVMVISCQRFGTTDWSISSFGF
jgi:hypothetical protein